MRDEHPEEAVEREEERPEADRRVRVAVDGAGGAAQVVHLPILRRLPSVEIAGIADPHLEKARTIADRFQVAEVAPDMASLPGFSDEIDALVICTPNHTHAELAVSAGRILVPLSVGALLDNADLVETARATSARIIAPTGALLGLDAVRAAAQGEIESVTMITRKPPEGLEGAPYVVEQSISLKGLTQPRKLFSGPAREAAKGFPANLNVGAALALAGIGPERTTIEIWADPSVTRNTHTITVVSDSSDFTMTIENRPTQSNPRTGKITALSLIATLKRLSEPLVIGT
jgi:aspartate dehydrogenase